jgi:hypothetical protein
MSQAHPETLFLLTNATPLLQSTLHFDKAIHVIRDPRDIIVSGYFSHRFSHAPWNEDSRLHFEALKKLSLEDGLCKEIEFSRTRLLDMQNWNYNDHRVLELRYELLVEDPSTFATQLFEQLGLISTHGSFVHTSLHRANRILYALHARGMSPARRLLTSSGLDRSEVNKLVEKSSFEALTGRPKGLTDHSHHLRKGSSGDWKNHFSSVVTECFKKNLPGIVSHLGYEQNEAW